MITRNMAHLMKSYLGDASRSKSDVNYTSIGGTRYVNVAGYSVGVSVYKVGYLMRHVRPVNPASFADKSTVNPNVTGVVFGTGNTPPTTEDITLSGEPVNGFTSSMVVSEIYGDNYIEVTGTYTITNNNDNEITIGEVALFGQISSQLQQYYDTYNYYPIMFERTALENPITIPAGGVGQITYTVRTNLPAA